MSKIPSMYPRNVNDYNAMVRYMRIPDRNGEVNYPWDRKRELTEQEYEDTEQLLQFNRNLLMKRFRQEPVTAEDKEIARLAWREALRVRHD